MRFIRWSWLILLPWLVFYLLIPPFHIPDEYGHYSYIQALASGHWPFLSKGDCYSDEVDYFTHVFRLSSISIMRHPLTNQRPTKVLDDTVTCSTQAQHPPLYYLSATAVYKLATAVGISGLPRYNIVRFVSLIYFLAFLWQSNKVLAHFFSEDHRLLMTLMLGWQPMVLQLGTHINPEISVMLFAAATLNQLLRVVKLGHISTAQVLLLASLSLAAFYSKVSGVVLFPVVTITLLFWCKGPWKDRLRNTILFVLWVIAAISPYFLWNLHQYGRPLENGMMYLVNKPRHPSVITTSMKVSYLVADFQFALYQLSGSLGRLTLPPFLEISYIYAIGVVSAILTGIIATWNKKKEYANQIEIMLLLLLITLVFLVILSYEYQRLAWMGPVLQVRYGFVALLPAAIFFWWGVKRLLQFQLSTIVKCMFLLSVLHFNYIVLWLVIPGYYI